MRISITIEVEMDDGFFLKKDDEKLWFENEVMVGDGSLILHSNEIGDSIGVIKSVKRLKYLDPTKESEQSTKPPQ